MMIRPALLKMCRAAILSACSCLFVTVAAAQDGSGSQQDLRERIARLESAIQDLQASVYSVEGPPYSAPYENRTYDESAYADGGSGDNLALRLSSIEQEMQRLTGRIEELAYRLDQQAQMVEILSDRTEGMSYSGSGASTSYDTGYGMPGEQESNGMAVPTGVSSGASMETGLGSATATGPAQDLNQDLSQSPDQPQNQDQTQSVSINLPDDPAEAYNYAYQSLLDGRYAEAEQGFLSFLEKFPADDRAPDAKFRLGEIYLVTGAYGDAATAFLEHIQTWPNDTRAAESYLKLGTSFSRAGKSNEACQVFNALQSKYPKASRSVLQRLTIERGKAGC